MYYTLENFIDYCDNMGIAEEGKLSDWIRKRKEKPKSTETISQNNAYVLDTKSYSGMYSPSKKVNNDASKIGAIQVWSFTQKGLYWDGMSSNKRCQIRIHNSCKAILKSKVYLYTLDMSSSNKSYIDKGDRIPIKNIECDTFENMLKNNGIDIKYAYTNISERQTILQKIAKEYIDLVCKYAGNDARKALKVIYNNGSSKDEIVDFAYGFENRAELIHWDLWEFNSKARTDNDRNNIF